MHLVSELTLIHFGCLQEAGQVILIMMELGFPLKTSHLMMVFIKDKVGDISYGSHVHLHCR